MRKVVFITGASSGIGEQTAYLFAENGYSVIITYRQEKEQGERVGQECLRRGASGALVLPLDLTKDESIESAVGQIVNKFGEVDILINNAGILINKNLRDRDFEEIAAELRTNLEGPMKLTAKCVPYIRSCIINVGSILSRVAKRGLTSYCASKAGLLGFTRSLARELPNLRIYQVNPGLTSTRMGNLEGVSPKDVARVIFDFATFKYNHKSGEHIAINDYLPGHFLRRAAKKILGRN